MMEVSQLRSELRKGCSLHLPHFWHNSFQTMFAPRLKKFAQSNQAVVSTNQQFLGTSSRYQADKISLDKSIKKCLLLKPTAPESELREKDMAFSSHKQQHEVIFHIPLERQRLMMIRLHFRWHDMICLWS